MNALRDLFFHIRHSNVFQWHCLSNTNAIVSWAGETEPRGARAFSVELASVMSRMALATTHRVARSKNDVAVSAVNPRVHAQ